MHNPDQLNIELEAAKANRDLHQASMVAVEAALEIVKKNRDEAAKAVKAVKAKIQAVADAPLMEFVKRINVLKITTTKDMSTMFDENPVLQRNNGDQLMKGITRCLGATRSLANIKELVDYPEDERNRIIDLAAPVKKGGMEELFIRSTEITPTVFRLTAEMLGATPSEAMEIFDKAGGKTSKMR